ncbi:flagellar basal body P-ring formation chaperone FlgA [Sulfurimonas sp.]|uniref:flagellar basal body P-ring formation chaperone FlgA n=1 Tax=Sulfurimonas sp. TaxID=2022749 RepID=UPI00261448FD|nr:flagellar basal body P-ring formation chaperone FlgA [Sulfurimonas sp.]MDD5156966.1 flagellar basal body P-ring formation chaperone FlgA [Sulfurimonas sp.]
MPNLSTDSELYTIEENRHSLRIKTADLLKILKINGYQNYTSKHQYINFIVKSDIDTSKINLVLSDYYKEKYRDINIKEITITPMSYTVAIPEGFTVNIQKDSYLSKKGILSIKTLENKKIFLNYIIDAEISLFLSSKQIKKDDEISLSNSSRKKVKLEKLKDTPVQNIGTSSYQAKHYITENMILTTRDIRTLVLVKRNSSVSVSINDENMVISSEAKALEDGALNDTIDIQKSDKVKLKAKVIGKNMVEII